MKASNVLAHLFIYLIVYYRVINNHLSLSFSSRPWTGILQMKHKLIASG